MPKDFNEATRVQMPALVHLTRIGYEYFGKISEENADTLYDSKSNILIDVFKERFCALNPGREGDFIQLLKDIDLELDNDDLGKSFYKRLIAISPLKLIDFDNPLNNVYHCTAEFTCKRDDDEFRPDITLFVNGLPLVFIEVKKPHNKGGMIAESKRMNDVRFPNKKFRRFINMTQLMIFSNNMEYDACGGIVPIQGVFYCTGARKKAKFSVFREENPTHLSIAPFNQSFPYKPIDPEVEKKILSDFNCQVIHTSPEYQTNLDTNSPTNRIITSMCCPERLLFILKYGIAYVHDEKEEDDGTITITDEKHIMRYQQMFASFAIKEKLEQGINSGVIWHTQGSGKTALAYHLNYVLTDYFSKKDKVAKFYFIVDRIDLLEQAMQEFTARGLVVKTASTRKELMEQFKTNQSLEGDEGKNEVTVVNIQRFEEDHEKVVLPPYATNLQRIFIIDEAHRGYNPAGSFLANLFEADPNSIKIALTGTPLLKAERASWKVFGNYYHTYYYDRSIQDGYTLKIIREPIEKTYKEKLSQIYEQLEKLVQKKDLQMSQIIEHESYVKELLRYIIKDLKEFRMLHGDDTLGGMIICETSEQARKLFAYFDEIQNELNTNSPSFQSHFKAGLILYDSDDKETRKQIVKDFKKNMTIDILIVFNMLLTGFDAPRLKRLYFGRKLRDHSLLQAITRVNRPYKDNRYGYVIDFADIKKNFDETNDAYLKELNKFNNPEEVGEGNETDTFTQVLEDPEEIINQVKEAKQVLFEYTTDNAEIFSQEISDIEEKEVLLKLKKALVSIRDCFNMVRTFGDDELKKKMASFDFGKLPALISEVQHAIDIMNQKEALEHDNETTTLINEAMKDISFKFNKMPDEEMKIISGGVELDQKWRKAVQGFTDNIDPEDPEFITLREAFIARFKEHGFVVNTHEEYEQFSKELDDVIEKLHEMQKKNEALRKKYNGDAKFVRVHKRIREENIRRSSIGQKMVISQFEDEIRNALLTIKTEIDQKVYDKNDILKKDAYFEQTVMVQINAGLEKLNLQNTREDRVFIQSRISAQYLNQYRSVYA